MPEPATTSKPKPSPPTPDKTCPECGGPVWDADSAQNHVRQHWPRAIDAQPQNAKAAVRKAFLLGRNRPEWTDGDLAADKEAERLGVKLSQEE